MRNARGLLSISVSLLLTSPVSAQVIPDRSLPINSSVIVVPGGYLIQDGTTVDRTLFHSFQDFSLPNGEFAQFDNASQIQNIISRVTGLSPSYLNGILQTNGTANLIFLNPNGIIFGPNAQILVGGAFLATTANNVRFNDGQRFGRSTPDFTMTVAVPIGLDFTQDSGKIEINNVGHQIFGDSSSLVPLNRTQKTLGIQALNQQTYAFIGNGIDLDGGVVTANGGHLEIASINDGTVNFEISGNRVGFNYEQVKTRANINLINRSVLDGVFFGGNAIHIYSEQLNLKDGSLIAMQNLGVFPDLEVQVNAKEVNFTGVEPNLEVQTGIITESLGSGDAGNIIVNSERVNLTDGGGIGTVAFMSGSSGLVEINAKQYLRASGVNLDFFRPSVIGSINLNSYRNKPISITSPSIWLNEGAIIFSTTVLTGKGADINVTGRQLILNQGGSIFSNSFGIGQTGDIQLNISERITLTGTIPSIDSVAVGFPAAITNLETSSSIYTFSNQQSRSGDLLLKTEKLEILNGGNISSIVFSQGQGGNVHIEAKEILMSGRTDSNFKRQPIISSTTLSEGDAGTLTVIADNLILEDGARISTSSFSSGNAGNLFINVKNAITLRDSELRLLDSTSIDSSITRLPDEIAATIVGYSPLLIGDAGSIHINANTLLVDINASISTQNDGLGRGGDINLNVQNLELRSGKITASTLTGTGGNINVRSNSIVQNRSTIEATVTTLGDGGNININSRELISLNHSKIRADAFLGNGGNVQIFTPVFFQSLDSSVTASSQLGIDGTVNVDTTPYNFDVTNIETPTPISPSQVALKSCYDYAQRLTQTGQGQTQRDGNRAGRGFDELIPMGQVVSSEILPDGRVRLLTCQDVLKSKLPQN